MGLQMLFLLPMVLGPPCPSGAAASLLCKKRPRYLVKAPRGLPGPDGSTLCSTVAAGERGARVWPGLCPAVRKARPRARRPFGQQTVE